jgi:Fe-S-cluster containining protein
MVSKEANLLAVQARCSIGAYCFSECKSFCCRSGYIQLTSEEADLLTDMHKDNIKLLRKGLDGSYLINLKWNSGCPRLKENRCSIHNNPLRPSPCREFPLFFNDDLTIRVAERCPAVANNLLYPFLAQFKRMGFSLVYEIEPF